MLEPWRIRRAARRRDRRLQNLRKARSQKPKIRRHLTPGYQVPTSGPARAWTTYVPLVTATFAAVVSTLVAIYAAHSSRDTADNNHRFEAKQAAAQVIANQNLAVRQQRIPAYQKIQSDLVGLEKAMFKCYSFALGPAQPGQTVPSKLAEQEAWIYQHIATPVQTASDQLLWDSFSLSTDLSPAVAKLVTGVQSKQTESPEICERFNDTIARDGNNESPVILKEIKAVIDEMKTQQAYLDTEDQKIVAQIAKEL